jgi:NADH-quinone oxidoreductase subunit C
MMEEEKLKHLVSEMFSDVREDKKSLWCTAVEKDFLKKFAELEKAGLENLLMISGTDMGETIDIIYHFSFGKSEEKSLNIRLHIQKMKPETASITHIYPAAAILEREAFEMLGISFSGHPNMKKAFLDENSPKNPLLKG